VHRGRLERVAFWLVTTGTLITFIGLTLPHLTGQRSDWSDSRLRADTALDIAQGRDHGPGPAVGLAIVEGACCLVPMGLLAFSWLVLVRGLLPARWRHWTPLDEAAPLLYGIVAVECLMLAGCSWSMDLAWAAVGEFAAAVGYALAAAGGD
jgi:hypothetical protein